MGVRKLPKNIEPYVFAVWVVLWALTIWSVAG